MGADESPLSVDREPELQALRFGPFELELRSGALRRSGRAVHLQPQPFKVLSVLLRRPGEVVTREELQSEVWPAGTFVDFEQSLNFCVRQIRSALGDQATAPRYLETLPRRGYRWIGGPVESVPVPGEVVAFPRAVAAPLETDPEPSKAGPWPMMGALTLLAFAGLLALVSWLSFRRSDARDASFQRVTFRRGTVTAARFGPEGQVVYSAVWEGGEPSLHVARPDPRDTHNLEAKVGRLVAVSGAGEVAYLRGTTLYRAPLSDGPAKALLEDVMAADWSRDGTELAVVRRSAEGGKLEFPAGKLLADVERSSRLRISPDANHVALIQYPMPQDDRGSVVVFDRKGRKVAATEAWASLDGLAWSADGREVWFTAARVGADSALHSLDLRGHQRTRLASMGRLILHDVARDGRLLLERSTVRAEMRFQRHGQSVERNLSWLDNSAAEGLSADGDLLLFYESGEGGGAGYTTFLRRTDGSPPVRLGGGRATGLSPDGRWALSIPLVHGEHVEMLPTGAGEARRIVIPGQIHEHASWLGDGSGILVQVQDPSTRARSLWQTARDGTSPRKLEVPAGVALPDTVFHPDGSRYVMVAKDGKGGGAEAGGCPDARPCVVDLATRRAEAVRGAEEGWRPVAWDTEDRIWFRSLDRQVRPAQESLHRVHRMTGRAERVVLLTPRDRAGLVGLMRVVVAGRGEAWALTALRRLSDLFVVTGIE